MNRGSGRSSKMSLQDAFTLFRRLGADAETISRAEFNAAYIGLARRYHPDARPNTEDLNGEHRTSAGPDARFSKRTSRADAGETSRLAGIAAAPFAPFVPRSTPHR